MSKKPRVKAGTSQSAAADRRQAFVDAYICNGRNATQAAITAGYSAKTAGAAASRLLTDVKIAEQVAARTAALQVKGHLTVERTLQEVARLAYFDPRKIYDEHGKLLSVHHLDDDTAAAISSVEVEATFTGQGEARKVTGFTKKMKFLNKGPALDMAMRHLGMYEKDNSQRGPDLALQVVLVGPP